MRPLRVAAVVAAAIAASMGTAVAAPEAVLGYDDARHLLARTGFGPTDAEVRAFAPLTRRAAVDRLLRETRTAPVTPPPAFTQETALVRAPRGDSATEDERKAFRDLQAREGVELRAWWIREMVVTPSPLTERMTLFWHNHFVSGQQKVRHARLMYRQNVLFREHALGRFGPLLHAIARDGAMVVYLDLVQNRRGSPNENFAREVMELFTLGEGHYTEQDVKEAARAFTGWSLDRDTGVFVFRRALHDGGVKTVFGRTGPLDGDAVLDLLLDRPETAEFLVAKLWREFVSPDPDPAEVQRIATAFRGSGYDVKVAVGALLTGDAFYAPAARGTLVKSPVDIVVGTLRQLDLHPDSTMPFAVAAAGMGQNLFSPPNVKGWPGGEAWINTQTLLARKAFLDRVVRIDEVAVVMPVAMTASGDPAATGDAVRAQRFLQAMQRGVARVNFDSARFMAEQPGATPAVRAQGAQRLLLATAPLAPPDPDADSLRVVRALLLDPAYQVK